MVTLFVAPTAQNVGLTSVALGLARALQRSGLKVAFLKPVAQDHAAPDASVHFARALITPHVPDAVPLARAEALLGGSADEQLMEEVVTLAAQATQDGADVLVVEGVSLGGRNPYAAQLNVALNRNLTARAVLVASLEGRTPADLADGLEIAAQDYSGSSGEGLAGYVLNFLPRGLDFGALLAELRGRSRALAAGLPLLGVIGENTEVAAPRTRDIAVALGARVLNAGEMDTRRVTSTLVSARSAPYIVDLLKAGTLVVAPGDREDVIMATSLAHLAGTPLAGLLLTAGQAPEEPIWRLCQPALGSTLPVLLVESNTYVTAGRLTQLDRAVPPDDTARMERTLEYVADRLDTAPLRARATGGGEVRLPPAAFRHHLITKARVANKRIVLPEGDEPRTVRAAAICHEKGIARCVLLAKPERVRAVADAQGVTLPPELEIIDPDEVRGRYVEPMVELRRSKGLTAPMAEAQLEDTVVLGTMMLAQDEVDGLVSGAVHTTANTVRPALQLIKTAPGATIVSSVFFMLMPEQVLVYGDAAINPNPDAEQLAEIAVQSADSAKAFGITPRVAMISYSTGTSGAGEDVEKVKRATDLVRERRPDIMIDGPLQYDAASVLSVGEQKAPGSPVAGRATVFIFPDLNTGNTTYKAVQRSAGVVAVGPMLQGLNKPVNDLSRGALVDDIVYTIALTAIQSTQ
ncbi:phosphate acetyltransferase [Deinococcus maricopensis]|uniref:Phosphate acetyltransferase n=1 Tax=Deinococcus maricopensis (strain DSM 21211 / LMG 22137 / NRRL B-23946 / LB-34) TaxID=709986 RepID=E8U9M2_DEIML|nr:phosphate acetyltransferase [Deinococcus maricopensis]ADV67761.1 phosphate acetyltransferase [Deinococcus maricopensis DSM 21211]